MDNIAKFPKKRRLPAFLANWRGGKIDPIEYKNWFDSLPPIDRKLRKLGAKVHKRAFELGIHRSEYNFTFSVEASEYRKEDPKVVFSVISDNPEVAIVLEKALKE